MNRNAHVALVIVIGLAGFVQISRAQPMGLKAALLPAVKDGGFQLDGQFL